MDTLDMEDRIVKLEQWQREHTAKHIKDMETHHTDVLLHGYGKADFREAVEKYRQEALATERKYQMAKQQLDYAKAVLGQIADVEKRAGLNLENSPATQAVQKLAGTLIPEEKGGK